MKLSELREGATYIGKSGGLRKIKQIETSLRITGVSYLVFYSIPGRRGLAGPVWARTFARWAEKEVV